VKEKEGGLIIILLDIKKGEEIGWVKKDKRSAILVNSWA